MNKTLKYSLFLFSVITGVNFGSSFIFNLIGRTYAFPPAWRLAMIALASAVSALIITLIIISTAPVLKNYLTTFRRLLRLDTLSHPILLRLQKEAPSTFQHSLQVANLSNIVAKAVAADAFLVRIGGYYHDIGKLKDPKFYLENRISGQSARSSENPHALAKKIHNHVREGVKLAREYKLPEEVVAFIPQHHGTLLASGIYQSALESGLKVKKSDFRYPGPKPLSREAAILMLSDAIESKLRTLKDLTYKNISESIETILHERISDKQLEFSGLTKTDLAKMRSAYIKGAQILYHQRIKYPSQPGLDKHDEPK